MTNSARRNKGKRLQRRQRMRKLRVFSCLMTIVCLMSAAAQGSGNPSGLVVDGTGSELNGGTPYYTGDDAAINSGSSFGGTSDAVSTASTVVTSAEDMTSEQNCTYGEEASDAKPWAYDPEALTAQWQGKQVTVLSLGSVVSAVVADGEKKEVPTRELSWETTAEEGRRLAVINAPKSGSASLRRKASSKSAVLEKCRTGSIVAVLALTKKYAKINYQGAVGYVSKSALTFLTPSAEAGLFATIAYKGNVKSHNTVKVRMTGSSKSRILGEYPCGTRVTVLLAEEKWTQIEVDGRRCAILTEFLLMDAPAAVATATDTDVP